MWYNPIDASVLSWGGLPYDVSYSLSIWAFKPDGQGGAEWVERYSPSSSLWTNLTSPFGSVSASGPRSFYSLGGGVHWSYEISGLAVFDFQDSTWSNLSSAGYSNTGYAMLGEAQFVPLFGQDGLLVMLGGSSPTNQSWMEYTALADMSNITVYDISAQQWHHQTASGDIPPPRTHFCMVGAQEASRGSYEL